MVVAGVSSSNKETIKTKVEKTPVKNLQEESLEEGVVGVVPVFGRSKVQILETS